MRKRRVRTSRVFQEGSAATRKLASFVLREPEALAQTGRLTVPLQKAARQGRPPLMPGEFRSLQRALGNRATRRLKEAAAIRRWGGPEPLSIATTEPAEEGAPLSVTPAFPQPTPTAPTNNPDALTTAALEMLFRLYATLEERFVLLPANETFSRDWVMGTAGTAYLRGEIRAKMRRRLGQEGQRAHLLGFLDTVRGTPRRIEELRFIIDQAFARAADPGIGVTRAQQTAPALVDVGRENVGRTFGRRTEAGLTHRIHAAMDIGGPEGTGVYAPISGTVVYAGAASGYGNLIILLHETPPPTEVSGDSPMTTNYAHLQELLVNTGDTVRAGQAIGLMGRTRSGRVRSGMGVHLHFSVQTVSEAGLPEPVRRGRLSAEHHEEGPRRIHPGRWLDELGIAVRTVDRDLVSGPTELVVRERPESGPRSGGGRIASEGGSDSETVQRKGRAQRHATFRERVSPELTVLSQSGLVQRDISATELRALDSAEQTAFMRRVYQIHCSRSARRRTFVGDLPAQRLAEIEDGIRARSDAAASCSMLLHAAREALQEDQQRGDRLAAGVASIGVASGYRSARRQFNNWRRNFPRYYRQTAAERQALSGGAHGDAAARYLARYIGGRLAAPGYSLHNSGIAIDFKTRQGRHRLGPSTAQIALWQGSWFYRWLSANAQNFGFAQNPAINEPWHWELVSPVEVIDFT